MERNLRTPPKLDQYPWYNAADVDLSAFYGTPAPQEQQWRMVSPEQLQAQANAQAQAEHDAQAEEVRNDPRFIARIGGAALESVQHGADGLADGTLDVTKSLMVALGARDHGPTRVPQYN